MVLLNSGTPYNGIHKISQNCFFKHMQIFSFFTKILICPKILLWILKLFMPRQCNKIYFTKLFSFRRSSGSSSWIRRANETPMRQVISFYQQQKKKWCSRLGIQRVIGNQSTNLKNQVNWLIICPPQQYIFTAKYF